LADPHAAIAKPGRERIARREVVRAADELLRIEFDAVITRGHDNSVDAWVKRLAILDEA
jgi:hypothetical protein